jgi:hypothetical protein
MIYIVERQPPKEKLPWQISDQQRALHLRGSGYLDALERWSRYEQEILARHGINREIVAVYGRRAAADDYVARHSKDDSSLTVRVLAEDWISAQ